MGGEAKAYTIAHCNKVIGSHVDLTWKPVLLMAVPCFSAVTVPNWCAVDRQAF